MEYELFTAIIRRSEMNILQKKIRWFILATILENYQVTST